MRTTMKLLEFLKALGPAGLTPQPWQERLMESLESVESTNELKLKTQTHCVGRNKRYVSRMMNKTHSMNGGAGSR